ncbi:MAG TPA: HD domain-containing protein [Clostridia bacterium]|nr:HD domain-containing protein [Clostridia bacterium]
MAKKKFTLEFVDHVLDNVHGFIDLTAVEQEIVELPIFKRLQSIKQLSLVSWIFPGAEHTRYIHSLGVMLIIDKMACKLNYTDEDRQLVRLAALLHDIGHYPLSHAGEKAYKLEQKESTLDFIESTNKETLSDILNLEIPRYSRVKPPDPYHHEKIGQELIAHNDELKRIIHKHCPFIIIDDLCAIITGNYDYDKINSHRISDKIQLLHSEFDADRVDYLLRDSSFSGARYGAFDFGVVLKNLKTCKHLGANIVGVMPKGLSAIDQYQINRFFSYTQVVFNRHVMALDTMVVILMRYFIRNKVSDWLSPDELMKAVQSNTISDYFISLNDNAFWNAVREINKKELKPNCPPYIKQIAKLLVLHKEIENSENFEAMLNGFDDCRNAVVELQEFYNKTCLANGICVMPSYQLTPHLGEQEYVNALKSKGIADPEINDLKLRRYQDGLVVIDRCNDFRLVIDDKRSISRVVKDICSISLRRYKIQTN